MRELALGLDKLRHVRVSFEGAPPYSTAPTATVERRGAPGWFVALIHPGAKSERIEAVVEGRARGAFVVAGDPGDEIAELWDGLVDLALDGGAAAALGWALLYFVVRIGLSPLDKLNAGLKALGSGDYRARIEPGVAPEFAELQSRFNALGASLLAAESENRTLRGRLVSIQDEERKEIARELHDEVGPHLFAARAHTQSARQSLPAGADKAARAVDAAIESIDALQDGNRRILNWLRPAALEELGLLEALGALRRFWEQARPDLRIELHLPDTPPRLSPAFQAALYRMAQEAITNVARHAQADCAIVSLTMPEPRRLVLSVRDNGTGIGPEGVRTGLGLLGIAERAATFGGVVDFLPVAPHGLEVRATFARVEFEPEA